MENAKNNMVVFLNSRKCKLISEMPSFRMPEDVKYFFCCEVPRGALHDGGNQLDLIDLDSQVIDVSWVEIIVL